LRIRVTVRKAQAAPDGPSPGGPCPQYAAARRHTNAAACRRHATASHGPPPAGSHSALANVVGLSVYNESARLGLNQVSGRPSPRYQVPPGSCALRSDDTEARIANNSARLPAGLSELRIWERQHNPNFCCSARLEEGANSFGSDFITVRVPVLARACVPAPLGRSRQTCKFTQFEIVTAPQWPRK
jgi:hypothetical protein